VRETEWAIKNGQSRHWQHWVHNTQDADKNTIQKAKKMGNMDTTQTPGMNPGAHDG
jgi:predicted transposase YbfD/YdcC